MLYGVVLNEQGMCLDGMLAAHYETPPPAQLIISALERAMLVARPYGDPERYRAAARRLLAMLDVA